MKTQTLNIALPQPLVEKIDEAAKREYRNRSEFIREALRVYLKDMQEWEELFEVGQRRARKLGIKNERDVQTIIANYRHNA